MPIYRGTYFARGLRLKDSDGVAINIAGWTFTMQIRHHLADEPPLLTLTTDEGGLVVTDGALGRFELRVTEDQSITLPVGRYLFDVLRTDAEQGSVWLFGGKLKVKQPVTRTDSP